MMKSEHLVLCSGTLAPETPLDVTACAAHRAGFRGISMWGREYGRARRQGLSDRDIAVLLSDHDLAVEYLDPAWWWPPGAEEIVIPPEADELELFSYGESELFAVAEAVGATSVLAIDALGGTWSVDEATEAFGAFCDRAAEVGLHVHLEFLPWSRIPDLAVAWQIVQDADRPNSGLALDAWHWYRGQPDLDVLRRVPAERITAVIVDDAPTRPEENLLEAAMHERLLPGTGGLDLVGLLQELGAMGVEAPIGVEVLSDEFHEHEPVAAAEMAATATRAVLAEAGRP